MSQKTRFKFDEVHFCHRVIDQTEREPIHLLLLATSCWAREIWKRAAHCAALIKKWKTFESMEQHPERRFLAGDFNRSVSSSFLAREKEKRSKVDGPKRSAVSCPSLPYSGGYRHPVDPSTRFLPKVFFPVWKGWIRTLSRNRKKTKKTCCCQDFHIRKENETAPHQYGLPFAFAFLTKRLP